MIKTLKQLIPAGAKKSIKLKIGKVNLATSYINDYKRFNNAGFSMSNNNSYENLRARITFYYHSLEKGMSNSNLRLGFGKNAFQGLFEAMDLYRDNEYPLDDIRYLTALSTIKQYIQVHKENNYEVPHIENKYNNFIKDEYGNQIQMAQLEDIGGYIQLSKEDLLEYKNASFDIFSEKRYSVRDFSEEPVDLKDIEAAIQIATKTPSVCNRQAWKVYVIKNMETINRVLLIQNGFNGFGENIDTLLVVTCDNQYLGGHHERNQTFIDGGMFSMSLLYGLENRGLANCTLNADLYPNDEKKIRECVNIGYTEDIILFIAVGNYPDQVKVAKSHRDDYKNITEYIL